MNTTTRGRYRKPGRLTHPLAVASMVGVVLLIGACGADTKAEVEPDPAPVITESEPEAEPVVDQPEPAVSEGEIFSMAMQMTSDAMSAAEVDDACTGFDIFGVPAALELIREGYGDGWDQGRAEDWAEQFIAERC